MDAPNQIFLGEVFVLCSVIAEDAAPEVHPFLFVLLFLHLLPNSEVVQFFYMTPMLLAAPDDVPFLKCIFFPQIFVYEKGKAGLSTVWLFL